MSARNVLGIDFVDQRNPKHECQELFVQGDILLQSCCLALAQQ